MRQLDLSVTQDASTTVDAKIFKIEAYLQDAATQEQIPDAYWKVCSNTRW